jgi:hypothetical protein
MVGLELLVDPYPTQHHQLREAFKRVNIIPPSPRRNHETFCQSATTLQPKKRLNKEKLQVRGTKCTGDPPFPILCTFYRQRVSVVSVRVQAISVLRLAVVAVAEGSRRLSILSRGPSPSLFDMLLVRGRGWQT